MKSRTWKWMIALSLLAALALPVFIAAQDNPSPDHKPKHKKYRVIDMGTFGGAQSFVYFQTDASPSQNSRGDLVGSAEGVVPVNQYSNGNTCFPTQTVNHAFLYHRGTVTDLGALSPSSANCSAAKSTNSLGIVAGNSENGVVDPFLGFNEFRAVVWKNGQIGELAALGGNVSGAGSINNRGQVVGFATNAIPDLYSFYYLFNWGASNGTQTRAILWNNGVPKDLGTLGGPDAIAPFVNEAGEVAGQAYTNSTPNQTTGVPTIDPFLWKNGTMQDLGSLGGTFGTSSAMNNRGQVAGGSNLAGDQVSHPFLWDGKKLLDLGTFGGSNGNAHAINDAGEVVGVADFPGDELHDAFLWRKGVIIDLGNLGQTSQAWDINSKGQVVGNSRIDPSPENIRPFLWENGGPLVDLNTLIPPGSDLTLVYALSINDRGEIAGEGVLAGCEPDQVEVCGHAYLLIPNGDCDGDCQNRVDQSQAEAELRRATAPTQVKHLESPVRSPEQFRNMMRQRLGLSGTHPTLRD